MKPKTEDRSKILCMRETFEATEEMDRKLRERAEQLSVTKSSVCRIALAHYLGIVKGE